MEKYFDLLKIKKYIIIGSYKNPERNFYGDIDLVEILKLSPHEFVRRLQNNIIKIREEPHLFFIDFKAGNIGGKPVKWTQQEILDGHRYFDNQRKELVSMVVSGIVKLDAVILEKNLVMPISINYYFNEQSDNKKLSGDIYLYAQELKKKDAVIEYIKKMRLFYTLEGDSKNEKKMNDILNSKYGLIYKYIGFLENILLLLESDNKGYSLDDIKNNFIKINKEIPYQVRYLTAPLTYVLTKHSMIITIPKVIKSLEKYISDNLQIDKK